MPTMTAFRRDSDMAHWGCMHIHVRYGVTQATPLYFTSEFSFDSLRRDALAERGLQHGRGDGDMHTTGDRKTPHVWAGLGLPLAFTRDVDLRSLEDSLYAARTAPLRELGA